MGWNSWNHFGCDELNENVIERVTSALVSTGMKASGYVYVTLDDCWMAETRDASGKLFADPQKFPSGMQALVDHVHSQGLKIGLYEDAGTATCAGRPGSFGHYSQDAATFAAWGIDYLKIDWCNTPNLDPVTQYTQFAHALRDANSNIVISICDWGIALPWKWAPSIANLWRTTPDIQDNWASMINNMEATSAFASFAKPGAWNDPDLLEIGNGGMTDAEYRIHFSVWSMLAAPLMAGNDLTAMSAATWSTLKNSDVIGVDQDKLGSQAILLFDDGHGLQTWVRQLSDGIAVALVNLSAASSTMTLNFGDIGLREGQDVAVRDLWAHADLGAFASAFSGAIPSHDVLMLKLSGIAQLPSQSVYEGDAIGNTLSGAAAIQPCPGILGSSCLDGADVTNIGGSPSNSITINNIHADTSAPYYLNVYAAVHGSGNYWISVNGGSQQRLAVTGSSVSIPATSGAIVELNAGNNAISFSNPVALAPDLDHIVITPKSSASPGFNIVYPTPNVAIGAPGESGVAVITLVPTNGFTGTVSIQCSVPPTMAGASCQGATVSLSGNSPVRGSLVITTTASRSAALGSVPTIVMAKMFRRGFGFVRSHGLLMLFALPILRLHRSRRKSIRPKIFSIWAMILLFAISLAGISGCGGAPKSPSSSATQPGKYLITINASSGTLAQSATFVGVVQ